MEEIVYDADGSIKGITLAKLFEVITASQDYDIKICEDILFFYRSFVTPTTFLEGLLKKFDSGKPKECSSELECSNLVARIQMR
jgi:hypothetical protein